MTPKGWHSFPLADLADQIMVGIASAATHAYRESGVLMIRNTNIKEGRIEIDDVLFIDPIYERAHKNKRLRAGDVITVRTGYPGISAAVPASLEGAQCFTSLITRPKRSLLDSEYLALYINSDLGMTFINSSQAGGAQKNVNAGSLAQMPILLPPLDEQRKIVEIVSHWVKAISTTDSLIAAKQMRKQALMQQLLTGKKRLSGFKKPWQTCRLGNLFDERSEGGRTDLPLLSITRDQGIIPRDDVERKDTSSDDKSKYLRICPGDIGYNTMRMWQGVSALSSMEGIISPAYTVCTPLAHVSARFMAHLFKFEPTVRLFERHSQGMTSDTWSLKYPNFAEIKATVPEKKEMEAVADIFDLANREIDLLNRRKTALEQQKKALMAVLLTGKKRLKT